jgi:hypothetical protein
MRYLVWLIATVIIIGVPIFTGFLVHECSGSAALGIASGIAAYVPFGLAFLATRRDRQELHEYYANTK